MFSHLLEGTKLEGKGDTNRVVLLFYTIRRKIIVIISRTAPVYFQFLGYDGVNRNHERHLTQSIEIVIKGKLLVSGGISSTIYSLNHHVACIKGFRLKCKTTFNPIE